MVFVAMLSSQPYLTDLVLRGAAPVLLATLAAASLSISIAVWWGVYDPAVSLVLRTTSVLIALLVAGAELWSVGTALFERSLTHAAPPTQRHGDEGAAVDLRRVQVGGAPAKAVLDTAPNRARIPTVRDSALEDQPSEAR